MRANHLEAIYFDMSTTAETVLQRLPIRGSWQRPYLDDQFRQMPEIGKSFKNCVVSTSRSVIDRQLDRITRNPRRLRSKLLGAREAALSLIQDEAAIAILLFHYANSLTPHHPERHLGPEGDVLDRLGQEPSPDSALVQAARSALEEREQAGQHGRGGKRHYRHAAISMAADHALELYECATGDLPGFTISSGPKGPAVDFLEFSLQQMGLAVSLSTLRRLIEAYRQRRLLIRDLGPAMI
jgi:hypothetical protein